MLVLPLWDNSSVRYLALVNMEVSHVPAHSGSALPPLRHLSASLPLEGAARRELQDGVPVLRASTMVRRRITTLLRKQKHGTLSPFKTAELDQYEDLDDYLSLLNRLVHNSLQGSKV
jgi:hypothetical protein